MGICGINQTLLFFVWHFLQYLKFFNIISRCNLLEILGHYLPYLSINSMVSLTFLFRWNRKIWHITLENVAAFGKEQAKLEWPDFTIKELQRLFWAELWKPTGCGWFVSLRGFSGPHHVSCWTTASPAKKEKKDSNSSAARSKTFFVCAELAWLWCFS